MDGRHSYQVVPWQSEATHMVGPNPNSTLELVDVCLLVGGRLWHHCLLDFHLPIHLLPIFTGACGLSLPILNGA